jgi:uncharacterized membrane protein YgcG
MARSLVQLLFFLALGAYVIHFARSTYSRPEVIRQRWFPHLPDRAWSLTLLRSIAVFWVFGGFMLIWHGVIGLPFLSDYHGVRVLMVVTVVEVAATALVISVTPRRDVKAL